MTSNVELLPCPFCGSPAEIDKGGFGEVFAACSKCWCHMGGAWSTTESDAIAAWNRRAIAAKDAEVEVLRAEVEMLRDAFSDDDMTAGAHWFGRYVEQKRRAERLAEALRDAADDLERGIDARIVVAQARAALRDQEEGQ